MSWNHVSLKFTNLVEAGADIDADGCSAPEIQASRTRLLHNGTKYGGVVDSASTPNWQSTHRSSYPRHSMVQRHIADVTRRSAIDHRWSTPILCGHICRLSHVAPAHHTPQICIIISQSHRPDPDWRRPPGHPRKTWLQQLEEDSGMSPAILYGGWSAQDWLLRRSLYGTRCHAPQWVRVLKRYVQFSCITVDFFG